MKKRSTWAQISLFLGFVALFFILNLVLPDKSFSEQENRYLQQLPDFSFSSLFSGKFTSEFETYLTDQFTLRDDWTSLKARCELLAGKRENNGVFLCRGDTLIEPFTAPASDALASKTDAVNKLAESAGVPVYFGLIPGKSELWGSLLPHGTPNDSQAQLIDACYARSSAVCIDLSGGLSAHAGEAIYYRTDHHWTSLGAYYGSCAILQAMGLSQRPLSDFTPRTVSESFFGTTYSTSGFSWVQPDSIETYVDAPAGLSITNYPQGSPVAGTLYDESFLSKKDKYSMFLGGNSPLQQIRTGTEDAPSLLIIRDSYADSLVPFLLGSFSEIHMLDLRYYRASVAQYISDNHIDEVLVLYSVNNFCTDGNLFLLGK